MAANANEANESEILWGKNKDIKLIGFNQLDTAELSVAKKIAGYYIQKIENMLHSYDEIKIRLKMHQRSNLFIHELEADIFSGNKKFNATVSHKNLFHALSDCFESLLKQIEEEIKDKRYGKTEKYSLGVNVEELEKAKGKK